MQLLVTGACGFVMSHVMRQWIERGADYRVIAVDCFAIDDEVQRFIVPYGDRVRFVEGSVTQLALWQEQLAECQPDYLIHGAAMTPNRNASEKSQAREVVDVNIQGVLNALEWARTRSSLRGMVHVSTGSIYGDVGPAGPLPEQGYEMRSPDSLYPITKRAGELLALRYRELFDLPLAVARLSSIFGPMDRWTPGRDFQCVPKVIVERALRGEPIRVSGVDAIGDWLYVADAASGLLALLDTEPHEAPVFNVAYGETVSIRHLIEIVAQGVDGLQWEACDATQADIVAYPQKRSGAWGAYDNNRLRSLGWTPRPIEHALRDYVDWIRDNRQAVPSGAAPTREIQ